MPPSTLAQAHPCTTNNSGALITPHHLLLDSRLAPFWDFLEVILHITAVSASQRRVWSGGSWTCGVCVHEVKHWDSFSKLKDNLWCLKDQYSILLNEPHNLAVLPPTSISISSINRRQNNSNFLCIMQPLIVPDQILAPRGYSFCSIGNHVLDKMQKLLSANVKCCRKPRRRVWRLLITLIYHITALSLTEHANHCWEQHGYSSDQKTLASSCSSERQQIHTTTVRSGFFPPVSAPCHLWFPS